MIGAPEAWTLAPPLVIGEEPPPASPTRSRGGPLHRS